MRYCTVRDGTVPCGILVGLRTLSYRVVMYVRMWLKGGVIYRRGLYMFGGPFERPFGILYNE
jgi:hypothetical protein